MDIKKKNDINIDDLLGAAILTSMLCGKNAAPKTETKTEPKLSAREEAKQYALKLRDLQEGFMDAGYDEVDSFELLKIVLTSKGGK